MKDYQALFNALEEFGALNWVESLRIRLEHVFLEQSHGNFSEWLKAVNDLPELSPSQVDLVDGVRIGCEKDLDNEIREHLLHRLKTLHPWRKGPYDVFGIHIDTEWRSDWKWDRLKEVIEPLKNRLVLDVGCGNGYHCWRMLGAGAKFVMGVDPTLLSVMQFQAIRKLHGEAPVYVLPLGVEDLPGDLRLFDTVFSMGVLYHRRSPIDHLLELKSFLRPGGQLVLETLVIEGDEHKVLVPSRRYAQMRNVWFIPSCESIIVWLQRCGYRNVRLCDVTKTTVDEQRSTDWMSFQSLADFLDPQNQEWTVEGLPAPVRAIFVANVE